MIPFYHRIFIGIKLEWFHINMENSSGKRYIFLNHDYLKIPFIKVYNLITNIFKEIYLKRILQHVSKVVKE